MKPIFLPTKHTAAILGEYAAQTKESGWHGTVFHTRRALQKLEPAHPEPGAIRILVELAAATNALVCELKIPPSPFMTPHDQFSNWSSFHRDEDIIQAATAAAEAIGEKALCKA